MAKKMKKKSAKKVVKAKAKSKAGSKVKAKPKKKAKARKASPKKAPVFKSYSRKMLEAPGASRSAEEKPISVSETPKFREILIRRSEIGRAHV